MDTTPRILYWGFTAEEKDRFDSFIHGIQTTRTLQIEPDQGNLPVHEVLFTDKRDQEPLVRDQKVLLFFNIPAEMIHRVMREAKGKDLPQPIYAMVTKENISWRFCDLVDHLVKEHEFVQRRLKERGEGTH